MTQKSAVLKEIQLKALNITIRSIYFIPFLNPFVLIKRLPSCRECINSFSQNSDNSEILELSCEVRQSTYTNVLTAMSKRF